MLDPLPTDSEIMAAKRRLDDVSHLGANDLSVAAVVARIIREEREACAKIADDHGELEVGHTNIRAGYAAAARKIAELIRNLNNN